jgi:hypothetical protein
MDFKVKQLSDSAVQRMTSIQSNGGGRIFNTLVNGFSFSLLICLLHRDKELRTVFRDYLQTFKESYIYQDDILITLHKEKNPDYNEIEVKARRDENLTEATSLMLWLIRELEKTDCEN